MKNANNSQAQGGHVPVLLQEVLAAFAHVKSDGHFLDCTFGGGGHSKAILDAHPNSTLLAIDQDPFAKQRAIFLAKEYGSRFRFLDMNFSELDTLDKSEKFDGILFDLGVSSYQLDDPSRGFSFRFKGSADMRMNPREGVDAATFLETASEANLVKAIRDYGEEKSWKKVINAIIEARGTGALQDTDSLADLIKKTIEGNRKGPPSRIHPATLSFQGIRIFINKEMEVMEKAIPEAFSRLNPNGILAVITFHSLEDRFVKRFFNRVTGRPEHGNDSRTQDQRESHGKLLFRKPVTAGEQELAQNPRSRSAKLRIVQKHQ